MAVAIHQQTLYWQRALQGGELQPATKKGNIFRPREPSNISLGSHAASWALLPARRSSELAALPSPRSRLLLCAAASGLSSGSRCSSGAQMRSEHPRDAGQGCSGGDGHVWLRRNCEQGFGKLIWVKLEPWGRSSAPGLEGAELPELPELCSPLQGTSRDPGSAPAAGTDFPLCCCHSALFSAL